MRIGINALFLLPNVVGGTETYARGLLHGFAKTEPENEYIVFVNRESAEWGLPGEGNFRKVVCPVSAENRLKRYCYEQVRLPALVRLQHIDLLHSLGYVAPLRPPCRSVVTVHDLNYRAFGSEMPLPRRLALEVFVRQSMRRAQAVITVSEFSRQEICRTYPAINPDKVVVIHEAPRVDLVPSPDLGVAQGTLDGLGIRRPYILAFNGNSPNKNVPGLLEAFARFQAVDGDRYCLVLVGNRPSGGDVDLLLARRGLRESVVMTGYLSDEALDQVLGNAELLVFPSFYEGFGLPVLEAMAQGVVVACSNRASLPEIAGNAAMFFDPSSPGDIAEKMSALTRNRLQRAELIEKGFENVARFSWERAARLTLQVYRNVLGEPV